MLIRANEVDLHYVEAGEGRPVLLLHGNGEDHTIFDILMDRLRSRCRVIALDSRGHGKSAPAREIGYACMMRDTEAFIRALGLERPLLVGFSDGGITGLMLASAYPDLLGGLVACGANTRPSGVKWRWRALVRIGYLFSRDDRLRMMLQEPDIRPEALAKISVPTLIVAGSRDIVPQAHTRAIAERIPNSTLRIMAGETHGSYIVHSDKLLVELEPFLAGL